MKRVIKASSDFEKIDNKLVTIRDELASIADSLIDEAGWIEVNKANEYIQRAIDKINLK